MPMLNPRAKRGFATRWAVSQGGYSLLEVMIAMAILALAITMSIPSMRALHERQQVREAFSGLNAWIIQERTQARLTGTQQAYPAELAVANAAIPEGWSIRLTEPWVIYPSGACSAGRVRVVSPRDRVFDRSIVPPECRAERLVDN